MMTVKQLRNLPKMTKLMEAEALEGWRELFSKELIKDQCNFVLENTRQALLNHEINETSEEEIISQINQRLKEKAQSSLKYVVNATGTVLHTNLGRSLLSESIMNQLQQAGMHYTNLEYNLQSGQRGSRYDHVEELLCELTGSEAALIVNNNAAAVMLLLSALLPDKEILVSRGELVEIGGSFRIPDVIESVGASLKEVGATNKTHLSDFEKAIGEATGAILRVHTSNYKVVGFTDKPSDLELVETAHRYNLPVFNDLGSGLLLDLQRIGLPYEPTVSECIQAGYDVVTFSGDKLLGGPQAGILVGKAAYINKIKKHPLLRALRVDKFTIAALEGVLMEYRKPKKAFETIPVLRLLNQTKSELNKKATELEKEINHLNKSFEVKLSDDFSQVGGGAFPDAKLPTVLVELRHPNYSESELEKLLRLSKHHIIVRVSDQMVQLDVRTLLKGDVQKIIEVLDEIG